MERRADVTADAGSRPDRDSYCRVYVTRTAHPSGARGVLQDVLRRLVAASLGGT
ncbi:hypothetical protein PV779_63380 [Streptomyces sp. ID01-9D]|nr:hypothetical protein [Streptomyces sp. ID01-9D]